MAKVKTYQSANIAPQDVVDIFKQQICKGNFVAASTQSGLKVGEVTNISPLGNITIDMTGKSFGKVVIPRWSSGRNIMIIENPQESLPTEFLSQFVE